EKDRGICPRSASTGMCSGRRFSTVGPICKESRCQLSPNAFYYHGRWLYEHGQITAEELQQAVRWLDTHDNALPCEENL
ncbi:MAG TPA: hypothetical protein VIH59_03015, partial [Candidatus Tectomicrobia bacterium]